MSSGLAGPVVLAAAVCLLLPAASLAQLQVGFYNTSCPNAEALVRQAVTVLTGPSRASDVNLEQRLHAHFARLTRSVVSIPHDPTLVAGGRIDFARLSPATREAWLRAAAEVAAGL